MRTIPMLLRTELSKYGNFQDKLSEEDWLDGMVQMEVKRPFDRHQEHGDNGNDYLD